MRSWRSKPITTIYLVLQLPDWVNRDVDSFTVVLTEMLFICDLDEIVVLWCG